VRTRRDGVNELFKAEAAKGARSTNPDAIDLTMRGQALLLTVWRGDKDKDKNDAARALFERALKIDPNEADALVGEANTDTVEYAREWAVSGTDYEAKALGLADRAIALAPDNVTAYAAKSGYPQIARRWDEAIRAADAGLAINPNSAGLYDERAWNENELGRFEQAKSDVQQAMRLSPRDPWIGSWHLNLGDAELGLGCGCPRPKGARSASGLLRPRHAAQGRAQADPLVERDSSQQDRATIDQLREHDVPVTVAAAVPRLRVDLTDRRASRDFHV
jgi:tetratricopeptide (TPR) repeat protein